MPPLLTSYAKRIRPILRKYRVRRCAVFGSVARGEERKNSDLDLLIDPPSTMGLFTLVGLQQDIEQAIGRRVDVGTFRSLHASVKKNAMKDAIVIYDVRG